MNYNIRPARYAKGMMAVHCISDGSGWKTRAMRAIETLNPRYSGRERSYIVSPAKARKFEQLMAAERPRLVIVKTESP